MSASAITAAEVDKLSDKNWRAHLDLKFSGREDKTIISHRQHYGPLVIQKLDINNCYSLYEEIERVFLSYRLLHLG